MSGSFRHDGPGTAAAAWSSRPEWQQVTPLDPLAGDRRPARVVLVAAHPDDESLGAGGLIARLHRAAVSTTLVVVTAGERSHPHSPTVSAADLAGFRRAECRRAWSTLGGDPDAITFWDLPDGTLADRADDLVRRLVEVVDDGRDTLLVTPWSHDGHPDHDALGRAGRVAAYRTGARLVQYPVWFWHRSEPDAAPWDRLRSLVLTPQEQVAKARAIAAHVTQTTALSDRAGDEALLRPGVLAHFTGPRETFVAEEPADEALDTLHGRSDDPWGTTSRWYEERKRALLLAQLPHRRAERALDIGCSTGTLTAHLAGRCNRLLALDRSAHAVAAAQHRLAGHDHIEVRQMAVPREWPAGTFDLIVVSESGYFLSPPALDDLIDRIRTSLAPGGAVILAHWRHPIVGWPLSGPKVHDRFRTADGLPATAASYTDRDVEIILLTAADQLPNPTT